MKRSVDEFANKIGYGTGFWTLLVGVIIAAAALVQLEVQHGRFGSPPEVERIPASDIYKK